MLMHACVYMCIYIYISTYILYSSQTAQKDTILRFLRYIVDMYICGVVVVVVVVCSTKFF